MLLDAFIKKYEGTEWLGPYENDKGHLIMSKLNKTPRISTPRKGYNKPRKYFREIQVWEFYNCEVCDQLAIREVRSKPTRACDRGPCYEEICSVSHSRHGFKATRENPIINGYGYVCWYEYLLDKDGNRIPEIYQSGPRKGKQGGWRKMAIFEHRVRMEEHLGRPLTSDEKVHHIDCNKLNNDISNLWVCTESQHSIAHKSVEPLLPALMSKECKVEFDRNEGVYCLA